VVVPFLVWSFLAILRPRALLVAEYLCLGQQLLLPQLIIRHPQPRLRNADRQFQICATLNSPPVSPPVAPPVETLVPPTYSIELDSARLCGRARAGHGPAFYEYLAIYDPQMKAHSRVLADLAPFCQG
jgi:hypothetical protein